MGVRIDHLKEVPSLKVFGCWAYFFLPITEERAYPDSQGYLYDTLTINPRGFTTRGAPTRTKETPLSIAGCRL